MLQYNSPQKTSEKTKNNPTSFPTNTGLNRNLQLSKTLLHKLLPTVSDGNREYHSNFIDHQKLSAIVLLQSTFQLVSSGENKEQTLTWRHQISPTMASSHLMPFHFATTVEVKSSIKTANTEQIVSQEHHVSPTKASISDRETNTFQRPEKYTMSLDSKTQEIYTNEHTIEPSSLDTDKKLTAPKINANTLEIKPITLDIKPTHPEINPLSSEIKPSAPDIKPTYREVKQSTPEIKPVYPGVKQRTPEIKPTYIEVKQTSLEIKASAFNIKPTSTYLQNENIIDTEENSSELQLYNAIMLETPQAILSITRSAAGVDSYSEIDNVGATREAKKKGM